MTNSVLPNDLQLLMSQIDNGKFHYAGREDDIRDFKEYLNGANFTMAKIKAERIVEFQQNARLLQSGALPNELQLLMSQIDNGKFHYTGREDDIRDFKEHLNGANFTMAKIKAERIIEFQQNA
ncbi:TPA: hypothetical protein ACYSBI_003744, partial [Morganella morganii]